MLSLRVIVSSSSSFWTSTCINCLSHVRHCAGQRFGNMSSQAKILGFAGATSGGKSSICKWLENVLPKEGIAVKTVHMDYYYWDEDSPNHVLLPEFGNRFANWEGKPLLQYFNKKYFFTLPKEECWKRRRSRTYVPPDPEDYFEKVVWPCYLKLKEELASDTDIVYLDGTRNREELFEDIQNDIIGLYEVSQPS
ncbi:hypothetical protein LSH36_58g11015 [Paralvinella palmiformis]|uniref:Nicotinamide riboside kinase 1 n=1 Tax=Paralvinella palmiformis TaxID=53620 RepID=A0AAD9K505_9ANNE|nr:hypothetical protein LSH36_58g11015 [Paralvinella palmiformis]